MIKRNYKYSVSLVSLWLLIFIFDIKFIIGQTWQQTLEKYFDRVDTFDHYDDWKPINTTWSGSHNHIDIPTYKDDGPKGIKLGLFDFGSNLPNDERPYSIFAWGAPYVSRGTGKSMVVGSAGVPAKDAFATWYGTDSYKGHRGPNWVKAYFGDPDNKDGTSGYSECYIFMRVYVPSNGVPTDQEIPNTKIYKYVEGHEYLDNSQVGNKMIAFLSGFVSAYQYHSPPGDTAGMRNSPYDEIIDTSRDSRFRYGDAENWLYQRAYKYDNNTTGRRELWGAQWTLRELTINVMQTVENGKRDAWNNLDFGIVDQLGAIEIYLKMSSTDISNDGSLRVWFYRSDGTVKEIVGNTRVSYYRWGVHATAGHKFNLLQLNGNSRVYHDWEGNGLGVGNDDVYFTCGDGMEGGWWIDDLIIDDQRIGLKYFELLSGNNPDTVPPNPPTGVTVKEGSSQQPDNLFASLNLTAQTSTKNDRDNLSNVRVYLDQKDTKERSNCVVFNHLINSSTIKIFNQSDHLVYKVENYQKPILYWYGYDLKGNKVTPGEYRYEITCGVDAVAGKIRIE